MASWQSAQEEQQRQRPYNRLPPPHPSISPPQQSRQPNLSSSLDTSHLHNRQQQPYPQQHNYNNYNNNNNNNNSSSNNYNYNNYTNTNTNTNTNINTNNDFQQHQHKYQRAARPQKASNINTNVGSTSYPHPPSASNISPYSENAMSSTPGSMSPPPLSPPLMRPPRPITAGPNIPNRASSSTMTLVNSPSRAFPDNSGSAFSSPPTSPGAYRGTPLSSNPSISPPASPGGYQGSPSPRHVTSDGGRGVRHPGQPSQQQKSKPRQQHHQYRPPQTHYRPQRQYRPPQPTPSPVELASDHPLGLTPPNPKFAHSMNANNHPGSNHNNNDSHLRMRSPHPPVGRPDSVVSVSSTHSNEPLNQPLKPRKPAQKTMMPRKPTAAVVTNPSSLSRGMNSIDLNDSKDKSSRRLSVSSVTSSASSTTKKKKRKGKLFSRMGKVLRGPRPYNPQNYKMTGMGKVAQFSNERLYLHWIRFGVLQGMIAIMLLSFGIGIASYVGIGALVLALLTLIYATQLYHTRHLHMTKKRKDAKFFARKIPTLLTLGLFVLYGSNFVITMKYGDQVVSPPPWTGYQDGFNYF